jgi:hypothetical protein
MRSIMLKRGLIFSIILLFISSVFLPCTLGNKSQKIQNISKSFNPIIPANINSINDINTPKPLDLSNGLVGYWNFNEGNGSIAHDSSGNGNDGTIVGATWVSGINGDALEITDASYVGSIPNSYDDFITTALSITCWIKWNGIGSYFPQSIIFDGREDTTTHYLFFHINRSGTLFFLITKPGSLIGSISTIPKDGTWTHIAAVFNDSSDTMSLYINGILDNTTITTDSYYNSNEYPFIGNNHWAPGDNQWASLNGTLDELRFYNRALTPEEIQSLAMRPIVYVDDDFNISTPGWAYDHFSSIQDGINIVTTNGTIYVYNGTYQEQINVTKSVVLYGENSTGTIIIGGFNISADYTTIQDFNITGGYEWDPDGEGLNGICRTGIYIISSNNFLYNNLIQNISGEAGQIGTLGGTGGSALGIYMDNSQNNNISLNKIFNIHGGAGGNGSSYAGAGSGGDAFGINLSSSHLNLLSQNIISGINGGMGGFAEHFTSPTWGDGGKALGISLRTSSSCCLNQNIIMNITGENGEYGYPGSNGGLASGISLLFSFHCYISENDINNTRGGNGGDSGGGWAIGGFSGTSSGIYLNSSSFNEIICNNVCQVVGGNPGSGYPAIDGSDGLGIYLLSSLSCNIDQNTIQKIFGGDGGQGPLGVIGFAGIGSGIYLELSSGTNITLNQISNINGGKGADSGENGGTGGIGAGIYLNSITNSNIHFNVISNITGGEGGYGDLFTGGTGGNSTGIYLQSSISNIIDSNIITYIFRGNGGPGSNEQGINGLNACVSLDSSSNNICYNNYFGNNASTAYDDCDNLWNVTKTSGVNIVGGPYLGGNYWYDYVGPDADNDGIGDIPYAILGGTNYDYLPLANQPPVANFSYSIDDRTVYVDASSCYDVDGYIVSFNWSFCDGTNAEGEILNHIYQQYGAYDVTLTVTDDDGNHAIKSENISIIDFFLPEIIDNTPSIAYTGDVFTFNATISDNDDIDIAFVYFWYNNRDVSVAPLSNTVSDYWEVSIIIENTLESLNYYFATNDISGNFNSSEPKNITIIDNDNPSFTDYSPSSGTTGDSYTFNVAALDNIAIANVSVSWSHGTHGGDDVLLNYDGDGIWSLSVTLDDNLSPMHYIITVTDTSDNTIVGSQHTIPITDNDTPIIIDHTPSVAHAGHYFTFNATVTDNIYVKSVQVVYWCDDGIHTYAPMINAGGDYYAWTTLYPLNLTSIQLHYVIIAIDTSGNTVNISLITIPIGPDYAPNMPETPSGPTSGQAGEVYTYTTRTIDIDGDQVYYMFDWGDGTNSGWVGSFNSGATASTSHTWTKGNYQIKVKAKDVPGLESDWSPSLPISMPFDLRSQYSSQFFVFQLKKNDIMT